MSENELRHKLGMAREALLEAIALRVSLYRNGDFFGEDDNLSDAEVARMETYARKWTKVVEELEKA